MAFFRGMDATTGRWMQVDPKAELMYGYTPYNAMGNNPISNADPNGDFIVQAVGAAVGGVVNLVDQALKGNVTSLGEGFAYFGVGAAAGLAVSTGNIGAARLITAGGNKIVQAVTGKFSLSDLNSPGDYAMLALDVGLDLMSPGLTRAISKPITKNILARQLANVLDDAIVSGGTNLIKVGGAVDDIGFSLLYADEFVVAASRKSTYTLASVAAKGGFSSFNTFKRAYGSAGTGNAWHHIVEQNADNVARFGAENIHNVNNLVKLPHGKGMIHQKVTGHYNSLMRGTNMRIRDYVKTLPYNEQYNYGIETLKKFGWTP